MASSKLLHLASSFLRPHRRSSASGLLLPPHSAFRPLSRPSPALRFCTAAAVDAKPAIPDAAPSEASSVHPWPEWDRFLEKLRSKGYFERPAAEGEGAAAEGEELSEDLNRVKNACLKFARDRFDILSSLPKQEVQAIVECGCPNLFRKAVNSAKRLRAFLQLDEGDVCSACKLRGSCDKAYVIAKDEGARTVDVVRILLSYAVDPAKLSGEYSVKASLQESARNLLSELIDLSDTTIDPSHPKPIVSLPTKKAENVGQSVVKDKQRSGIEMKRGDWLCPKCNFLNFARNLRCLECKEEGPKSVKGGPEMKLGDWTCSSCEFMNFARNKKCFRCLGPRPKRQLNPGEWECPSCDYVNFSRNRVCLKCSCDRPQGNKGNQFEDQLWKKPLETIKKSSTFMFRDEDDGGEQEDDDDILPLEGDRKFVASRRTTPSGRRLTAARKQRPAS